MTTQITPTPIDKPPGGRRPIVTVARSAARRDQIMCVAIAVILLVGIALLQPVMATQRAKLVRDSGDTSLPTLYAEFPRLTLGGFRGVLAMTLWIEAENEKNDRKWENLETLYDVIGKLEPYFVTVYTYHAWNQAYNLSAQWHDEYTKYKWVLDGMQYIYVGEDYNPTNGDLIKEEGDYYFLKLGGAFERIYYRAHWRQDMATEWKYINKNQGTNAATDTFKEVYNLVNRPEFQPQDGDGWLADPNKPGSLPKGYGVQLDGVKYRWGVSPYYFANKEYERCMRFGGPITTGKKIVRTMAIMSLRLWCRDDMYYTEDTLADMFVNHPEKYVDGTPDEKNEESSFSDKVLEMRDCFRNIQGNETDKVPSVAKKAIDEFQIYLNENPDRNSENTHRKHQYETEMLLALSYGESELLEGLQAWKYQEYKWAPGDKVNQHLLNAIRSYQDAKPAMEKYATRAFHGPTANLPGDSDYKEFQEKYVTSVNKRIEGISAFLQAEDRTAKPDLGFLNMHTVEK